MKNSTEKFCVIVLPGPPCCIEWSGTVNECNATCKGQGASRVLPTQLRSYSAAYGNFRPDGRQRRAEVHTTTQASGPGGWAATAAAGDAAGRRTEQLATAEGAAAAPRTWVTRTPADVDGFRGRDARPARELR